MFCIYLSSCLFCSSGLVATGETHHEQNDQKYPSLDDLPNRTVDA
ncbi:hypothetical protein LCGC14_0909130 [marine sediment metagenome]|uniref:Uncharacterized protein n=1 Tax=marine sediment metagenome TaxID=412755 RepID=A0A0F9RCY7_9ZZZZ